jgi:hypothetical protein
MASTDPTERENKPASRAMTEWLERQYDGPQAGAAHGGPEALAWDDHGLRVAGQQQPAVQA